MLLVLSSLAYSKTVPMQGDDGSVEVPVVISPVIKSSAGSTPWFQATSATVTFAKDATAATFQSQINAISKNLDGKTVTFIFDPTVETDTFNGSTDNLVGDGTTTTVTLADHGFSSGWLVSLDGCSTFNGSYTITVTSSSVFKFSSSVNASLTPNSAATARRNFNLGTTGLDFTGFYNGRINIYGATFASSYLQKTCIYSNSTTATISVTRNSCTVVIQYIRVENTRSGGTALYLYEDSGITYIKYCAIYSTTGYGSLVYYSPLVHFDTCNFAKNLVAVDARQCATVLLTSTATTLGYTTNTYGMSASVGGTIIKGSVSNVTGTTNETTATGGSIR